MILTGQAVGVINVEVSADQGQTWRPAGELRGQFEKDLTDVLGLKVEIKRGSGESGTMIVKYGNFDQLDYIRLRLTGGTGE